MPQRKLKGAGQRTGKTIRKTDRAEKVAPVKRGPESRTPMPLPAVDQRVQIAGADDELKGSRR